MEQEVQAVRAAGGTERLQLPAPMEDELFCHKNRNCNLNTK
jgi:hypothetical protein